MQKCEKCSKEFGSEEALNMHNKSKHPEQYKEPKRKLTVSGKKKIRNWVIVVVIIILTGSGFYYLITKDFQSDESLDFEAPRGPIHWHPHLTIKIDGKNIDIPTNVGISNVHYPIHTHEPDNILHMENNNPTKKTVTLGYFFEVFGKTFNKNCIFDYCTDKGILKMYVNGKENFDFGDYFMHDKDEILIEYNSTNEK